MARMQPEDTTYWLVREAFGWSVVLQVLWRFPTVPDRAALDTVNERLRHSVLNRRLIRARAPFARPRWIHADFAPDLLVDSEPIPARDVEPWSGTELSRTPLDPERGPTWRLRGVPLDDGGFVLSLTALHLVADGRTVVTAATAALTGTPTDPLGRPGRLASRLHRRPPLGGHRPEGLLTNRPHPVRGEPGRVSAVDDRGPAGIAGALGVADAAEGGIDAVPVGPRVRSHSVGRLVDTAVDAADGVGQVVAAGRGIVKAAMAFARARGAGSAGDGRPVKSGAHVRAPRARYSWATVSVDAAHWDSVARHHGGTANTLFIAVLVGVLRASGYGQVLEVGIPVSRRTEDDARGNATAGVSVTLTEDLPPGGDLRPLRRQCKDAFTRLSAGERAAHVHLLPLVGLLPTGLVVRAATAGSGMPDVVASNLGDFDSELRCIGGVHASAVAFRGIAQGVDPAASYRFGDGVQSWGLRTGDTWTFSVAAFDEECFPQPDDLAKMLAAELDGWGVEHRMW
ncbi:hypothetical protein [Nocardia caishijiensis]|uniref:hypothetical protein n=1 Tax=Nocardia caishijiensis TaxID=184756 RepID=UPI0012EED5F4